MRDTDDQQPPGAGASEEPPAAPPAFNPRGRTVFEAMFFGLVDGTRFGLRWAWRRLMGPPPE